MLLRVLFNSVVCFCSGIGVAAGTFAFLLVIRVIPRMLQKANLEHKVIYIENVVFRGIVLGTFFSLFDWQEKWIYELLGKGMLVLFGISAGIFTGCLSVALAEILDTFPIFFCRTGIKEEYNVPLLFVMAMGKMIGSLFFFLTGYGIIVP